MTIPNITLLAILDDSVKSPHAMLDLALKLQAGGVTLFQYRAKQTPIREMIAAATALKTILNVPLTINDRVDVCLAAKADGVHLGQDDMHPQQARQLLGEKAIIGITLKNEAHILNAPFGEINYGFLGGVFATSSKNNPEPPLGLARLETLVKLWKSHTNLPIGAIAGITPQNVNAVIKAGAQGVAVISALSLASNPAIIAQEFIRGMK